MRHRPSSPPTASPTAPDPVLVRLLWQWLVLGLMVAPWLPATLAEQIGPPWLWAVAAPLAGLLVLHRDILAAAGRRLLAPAAAAVGKPALAAFPQPLRADRGQAPVLAQARRKRRSAAAERVQARAA